MNRNRPGAHRNWLEVLEAAATKTEKASVEMRRTTDSLDAFARDSDRVINSARTIKTNVRALYDLGVAPALAWLNTPTHDTTERELVPMDASVRELADQGEQRLPRGGSGRCPSAC